MRFELEPTVPYFLKIVLFSLVSYHYYQCQARPLPEVVSYTTSKIPLLKTAQVSKLPYIFKVFLSILELARHYEMEVEEYIWLICIKELTIFWRKG